MTEQSMKQTIKQNKWRILISSIMILLPIIVGVVFWNELPEQMATHWGIDGNANGWSSRFFAVFALPLMILLVHWICLFFTLMDKRNREQNKKALGMIFWMAPVISWFANAAIYFTAFGNEFCPDAAMPVLIGIAFVVIGNYLPKCKHNYTLGIKVKWALEDEENWNATHRFGGKMWVVGGLLMMAGVFFSEPFISYIMIVAMLVLVVVPIVYSYWYYRKQCGEGKSPSKPLSIRSKIASWIILAGTLVLVAVLMFTGDIDYEVGESSFEIRASYWSDMTVDYDKITGIEYREEYAGGSRTNGYGSARLLTGAFKNEEFGSYTRYCYAQCDSCIVVEMGEKILVISAKDEEGTKKLCEELEEKLK